MTITTDCLSVPGVAMTIKHPEFFKRFDALGVGDKLCLINDYDPIQLYYELLSKKGRIFLWDKVEEEPGLWIVEITKKEEVVVKNQQHSNAVTSIVPKDSFVLNLTHLEPSLIHPTVFEEFDALQAGERFQLLNDHDPKPLYYQMIAKKGAVFSWTTLEKGPLWWKVEIRQNEEGETIGEIVAKDIRKANVFKKWGIDFCCGGKKTVKQVCEELNINLTAVEAELAVAKTVTTKNKNTDYTRWQPDFLIDYIYNQHHIYYYEEAPVINDLAEKAATQQGEHFPELYKVLSLFTMLQEELNTHFKKEEKVLFPFIKTLVKAGITGDRSELNIFSSVEAPVRMMEADHEIAGELLARIRMCTNNFTLPADSCSSFTLLYKKLQEFETDLHLHIHLENNILFPKAIKLAETLKQ